MDDGKDNAALNEVFIAILRHDYTPPQGEGPGNMATATTEHNYNSIGDDYSTLM